MTEVVKRRDCRLTEGLHNPFACCASVSCSDIVANGSSFCASPHNNAEPYSSDDRDFPHATGVRPKIGYHLLLGQLKWPYSRLDTYWQHREDKTQQKNSRSLHKSSQITKMKQETERDQDARVVLARMPFLEGGGDLNSTKKKPTFPVDILLIQ